MNRILFGLGLGAASISLVVGGQEGAIAQALQREHVIRWRENEDRVEN
jgi:hypothetical protein